jgi:uncharacterized membrane protein YjjB (DUF3815 family)
LNVNPVALLGNALWGACASAGFAVLLNVSFRGLPRCAAGGALALAVRTFVLQAGCTLEAASFAAAVVVASAVQFLPCSDVVSRDALQVLSCIPMIPGGFATKAILGLFAITAQPSAAAANEALVPALVNSLRVIFTIGALGTGVAIPTLLLRPYRADVP